jgi:hypothetical protein
MRGNSHVQFLGGWARATAPGYPATSGLTRAAIRLQMTRGTQDRDCSIEGGGRNPPEQQHRMRLYGASAMARARTICQHIAPSQRQGPLRSGFACP